LSTVGLSHSTNACLSSCMQRLIRLHFSTCLVDISVYHNGFHSDLNETFLVGTVDEDSLKLVRVTYECLFKAIEACTLFSLFVSYDVPPS
jgi:hypothetical protein